MAWNNQKQLTAEEILGMKPEDLKNRLDTAASKEDLKAITDSQAALQGTLSQLQASLNKLTTPPEVPDPTTVADQNDPTTQLLVDPNGYINRQTAGTQQVALETKAGLNEMRARQNNPGIFQKYSDQIMTSANRFPLAQRAQEGFWDFHLRTYLGDKLMKGELEQGSYPSLMGGSSFAPNSTSEADDPNRGFDPQVAAYLKERGIPLEKAAAITQIMVKNGDPIDIQRYTDAKKAIANAA